MFVWFFFSPFPGAIACHILMFNGFFYDITHFCAIWSYIFWAFLYNFFSRFLFSLDAYLFSYTQHVNKRMSHLCCSALLVYFFGNFLITVKSNKYYWRYWSGFSVVSFGFLSSSVFFGVLLNVYLYYLGFKLSLTKLFWFSWLVMSNIIVFRGRLVSALVYASVCLGIPLSFQPRFIW